MGTKKIVIITDAWHPQKNGVIVHCEKMKEELEKKGHSVIIIHPYLFPHRFHLPSYSEIELPLFPRKKLRKLLNEFQPHSIHIATEGTLGLSARMHCTRNNIPFTTAYHTHYPLYAEARLRFLFPIVYSYIHWFHKPATRTMASTKTLREYLEKNGFKNIVVAPLGVNIDLFKKNEAAPIPPELANLPRPFFVYFGRVAIEKNVEAFLRCKLPGSKIVIGGGPQVVELQKKYGNEVTFLETGGYVLNQRFIDLISLADVFVLPSKTETFGLVTLEALACEIPVAAFNVMGPRDILQHGVHGFIDDDLANAAIQCLTLPRKGFREYALGFSWEQAAQTFFENLTEYENGVF